MTATLAPSPPLETLFSQEVARREEAKKQEAIEHGKSAIYIANHAGACSFLDMANTPIELATKYWLGKKISVGCTQCASGDHTAGFFSADHGNNILNIGRWAIAEQFGDWSSVLITYGLQRHAPEVMNGLGKALTYVAGDIFRFSANHSAEAWGKQQGLDKNATEVKERAEEIYHYEISHLPQAVVWTGTSMAVTLAALKLLGDPDPIMVNLQAKMAGAAVVSLGVLGMRALSPDLAGKWDTWGSTHVAVPLTQLISNTIGLEKHAIDHAIAQHDDYQVGRKWLNSTPANETISPSR